MKPAIITTAIATLATAGLTAAPAPAPAPQKPNILVILPDQMVTWALGCYGGTEVGTPNIDTLAREGVLVKGFFVADPLCSPSRASLQTGLYPGEHGVLGNNIQIRQNASTWAEVFRDAGYQTGYVGKWHLDGAPKRPGWGMLGKDMGWTDHSAMYTYGHYKNIEQKPGDQYPTMLSGVSDTPEHYPTDWFTTRTIEFIDKHKDGPFCIMLGIPDPHPAYLVRPPYDTKYPPSTIKMPATLAEQPTSDYYYYNATRNGIAAGDDEGEGGGKKGKGGEGGKKGKASGGKGEKSKNEYDKLVSSLPRNKSEYLGMIKCIDDNVGRIIQYLKDNNLYDNTIIVFTSDHGDMMGEHALMAKGFPFNGCANVPFIVRYPAKIKPGTVCDNVAGSVDFYPTILALAGVEQKAKVSGKSFDALLTGSPGAETWENKTFYRDDHRAYPWLGVVTKDYKLVYGKNDVRQKALLIDRKKDPAESYNQIENPTYADVVKSLTKDIVDYCKAHNDPSLAWLRKRLNN